MADDDVLEVPLRDVRAGDFITTSEGPGRVLADAAAPLNRPDVVGVPVDVDGKFVAICDRADVVAVVVRLDSEVSSEDVEVDACTCDPVGVYEIAARLHVTRKAVDQWRYRGLGFPQARWLVGNRPAWEWSDVETWAVATGRS